MRDEVRPLSDDELTWLHQAEEHVNDISYRYFFDEEGEGQLDHTELDLSRLQWILNGEQFRADQLYELQCLGAVLGNVFVANTPMQWTSVTNEFGTSLALHHPQTGCVLYPLSMISKRVEEGRKIDIPALYRSFAQDLSSKSKKEKQPKANTKKRKKS